MFADERDSFANGLNEVMSCADDGGSLDAADEAAAADPGSWSNLALQWSVDRDIWDATPVPGGRLMPTGGDLPVLLFDGGLDPITPPAYGDARHLVRGEPAAAVRPVRT